MSRAKNKTPVKTTVRCAIYTRKSSEEGLDQEFNALDAQREAAESFIASQKAEGWTALPDRYDDGGYSGGSMERPALERLLRDIDAGKVDCVVVYKVDRLSRSLMDFARIMETFERQGVSFVSVTQHFNTTHSMGRLTLNILLSFAQFEREIIGERIRDKLAAQARKGKWTGGVPVLGYDVDRSGPSPRLVINAKESARVREIFRMYLREASLLPVVKELARRSWPNKRRTTKKGKQVGGRRFDKAMLHALLTNPIYTGQMTYKGDLYPGEHEPIIEQELFDKVQHQLKENGRTGGAEVRNKYGALLRGLLRCKGCDTAMTHTFHRGKGRHLYRYYRCTHEIKNGRDACTSQTLPAQEIEALVVDEVRRLGEDEALLAQVLTEAHAAIQGERVAAQRDLDDLRRQLDRDSRELKRLAASSRTDDQTTSRVADLHTRLADGNRQEPHLKARVSDIESEVITRVDAQAAFGEFDELWANLIPREQARLLKLLIATVDYDGQAGTVSVTFHPTSIRSLIDRRIEQAA
ncbi:recombinase family protein [Mucisphaera calidilacus]|uniref:DNA-invertase hin n=1 Tax=Mucisphaera calidilacus TaxID=2527982 RepID=A0A518BVS5_9BACT|nr:recombinase family protein [Mucisphaera calidilacus]QDU71082.1 DNA-invertase hin [Mucisphaera calidilacus]